LALDVDRAFFDSLDDGAHCVSQIEN
jgi:hypothetical protein